jgi:DMSO reductase anchor subunit
MIQRIQSVWLLIASFICCILFIMPLFSYTVNGVENLLRANNFYPLLLIDGVMAIYPLLAIFRYKERKQQRRFAIVAISSCTAFIGVMLMRISSLHNNTKDIMNEHYLLPGALMPVLSILFNVLAILAINKDEKLVKSMDRLR